MRVSQEERSRVMRQRLLDATIDCLVEHGWAGTTATLVSRRAGVSRGAQLHHFPTKSDLVVAAVQHLSEIRSTDLIGERALPDGKRTRAALDILAEHFCSPIFVAALEIWVAARTDEELLSEVSHLERRLGRETHKATVELLGLDESQPGVRPLVQATLDLLRGLGLANTLSDDRLRRRRILDAWAVTLDQTLDHALEAPA